MPNIGSIHPYVVHFVIGFLVAGVIFRLISITGRWAWTNQAAAALLIAGALGSAVAVRSGDDAHGPAERVPGSRPVVVEHEEWGERTRNLFLLIAALEVVALVAVSRQRAIRFGTAALGALGLFFVYETGEHGGELVYSHAGGVGLRTGAPEDVNRLLLAGLYHQAMQDRRENRAPDAARLFDEMRRRWPADAEVLALAADSRLRDAGDATGALAFADSIQASVADPRIQRNLALTRAYAHLALGQRDSAVAIVERLATENPTNVRYQTLLDSLR